MAEFIMNDTHYPLRVGELIRCRDCKFYTPLNRETKSGICSLLIHQNFGDDWYCAGAERRTDEPDKQTD